LEREVPVEAVVTLPPELETRYAISGYADMAGWLREQQLRFVQLPDYRLQRHHLAGFKFDVLVVNGWSRLIGLEVMGLARLGGIGVHAGHPPFGLGRAPIVWNMLLGGRDIEVYVFRLMATADDGPILARRPVEITLHEDSRQLYEKVMAVGADLIAEALLGLAAGSDGQALPAGERSYFPKRTAEDGEVDFRQDELSIYNFVRSQRPPYPGAFALLDGKRWTILRAQPFDQFAHRARARSAGTIVDVLPSGPVVQTGGATIWLTEVVVDGKRLFPATDRDAGRQLIGKRFASIARPAPRDVVSVGPAAER
jgi:methionyl-tRNA formyltransferase